MVGPLSLGSLMLVSSSKINLQLTKSLIAPHKPRNEYAREKARVVVGFGLDALVVPFTDWLLVPCFLYSV